MNKGICIRVDSLNEVEPHFLEENREKMLFKCGHLEISKIM